MSHFGHRAEGTPRTPVAATTLTEYHSHLKAALTAAVRSRHTVLSWNPAASEEARSTRGERKQINPLSEDEVHALFPVTRGTEEYALLVTLITTGMRAGEAKALRWQDADFARSAVSIRGSLHRENGKGLLDGPTKTRKTRLVSLRADALAVLVPTRRSRRNGGLPLRCGTTEVSSSPTSGGRPLSFGVSRRWRSRWTERLDRADGSPFTIESHHGLSIAGWRGVVPPWGQGSAAQGCATRHRISR